MKRSPLLSLLIIIIIILSISTLTFSIQFKVGGDNGWIIPQPNNTDAYNNWARQTRFQIGDTLYFKYVNDSLLVVNEAHYNSCNAKNPVSKHVDGNSVIELDHHGIFYFISGNLGHCNAGQKLIIDVLADHYDVTVTPAPAPGRPGANGPTSRGAGRDSWVPKSSAASAAKATVSSAVLSLIVVGYMFL